MAPISKKGIDLEYQGKRYISLHSLCDDLKLPYSEVSHRYHKTKDVEKAVEWGRTVVDTKKVYSLWGKDYNSLSQIATAFGVNLGSIRARLDTDRENTLEEIISDLLQKETIVFEGKEYSGISVLATAYGKDPNLVFDRLAYGNTLDRALKQEVRKINRPEYAVEYRGKIYESKRQLGRELGISIVCLRELMANHEIDFETAVDIYHESKERAGIPRDKMISYLPVCIINGRWYKTVVEISDVYKIATSAIATYKSRHGYKGILETLQAMQRETKPAYILDGKSKTYTELVKMGYGSGAMKRLQKTTIPYYAQLADCDFYTECVDVLRIYSEVKEEKLNPRQEQGMQMNM